MEKASSKDLREGHRHRTLSNLPYTYFHLSLITSAASNNALIPLDVLMARTYMTSALQQYLGLTGTAIPVDILKHDGNDVWIRMPREDSQAVQGALSQWVGKDGNVSWQIKGQSDFLGILSAGDGRNLFNS